MTGEVAYVSKVHIERVRGPHRRAYLPIEDEPIHFGVHSDIAEYYGTNMSVNEPRSTTLDYVVASAEVD